MIFGSSTMGIGLMITLRDRFTNNARSINSQFQSLYKNAQQVQRANLGALRDTGIAMTAAGAAGTGFFAKAFNKAAEFDFQMRTITGILKANQDELTRTATGYTLLEKKITDLGTSSIYTINEVGSAMEFLTRSGFQGKQGLAALTGVVNLGAAGGKLQIAGTGGVADHMAAIMHEFNLSADQSTHVANTIAKAANISSSNMMDFAQALRYVSGNAHRMGYDLTETISMLAVVGKAGLKGGVGGRSLNAMLEYLNRAAGEFRTGRQMDAFKALGLGINQIVDATGNLRPMTEILDAFNESLRGMKPVDAAGALSSLFMMRGNRAIAPMLMKSVKIGYNFADTYKQLMAVDADYAEKIGKNLMAGPLGAKMRLEDTMIAFMTQVGNILTVYIQPTLEYLTEKLNQLRNFIQTPLGRALTVVAAGFSVALLAGGAFLTLLAGIKLMTFATGVTMGNMAKTLAWAWNSAAASLLRYSLIQRGVTWTGAGGVYTMKGMKGFQKAGTASAAGKGFAGFFGNLSKGAGLLGVFGNLLKIALGPVGAFIGVLSIFTGLGNIVKGVTWAIGSLVNMIITAIDYLRTTFTMDRTYAQVAADHEARQRWLDKSMNFSDDSILTQKMPKKQGTAEQRAQLDQLMAANALRAQEAKKNYKGDIYLDGKKVGVAVSEAQADSLRAIFNIKQ